MCNYHKHVNIYITSVLKQNLVNEPNNDLDSVGDNEPPGKKNKNRKIIWRFLKTHQKIMDAMHSSLQGI